MKSPFRLFFQFSLGTWASAVLNVLTLPVITWLISPEEFGRAAMFLLAYNLLQVVITLGQDQSYIRFYNEIPEEHRALIFGRTLLPIFFAWLAVVAIIEFFSEDVARLLFEEPKPNLIHLFCITLLLGVLNRFGQLILRMKGRAVLYSAVQLLVVATNMAVTIAYATWINRSFDAVIAGFSASLAAGAFGGFILERAEWRSLVSIPKNAQLPSARKIFVYGLPFTPTFLIDWGFQGAERAFLRVYATFSEIGIYSMASRLSSSLSVVQTGFNAFWSPYVFNRFNQDPEDNAFYKQAFDFIVAGFSGLILLVLLAKDLLHFILGQEYAASINLFILLLLVPFFSTLSEVTSVGINLSKKTHWHFYIILAVSLVSLVNCYILIPALGAKGAVVANVLSNAAFFAFRTYCGIRLYRINVSWVNFATNLTCLAVPLVLAFLGFTKWWFSACFLFAIAIANRHVLMYAKKRWMA